MNRRFKLINQTEVRRIAHQQGKRVSKGFYEGFEEDMRRVLANQCSSGDGKTLKNYGQMALF